MRYGGRGIAAAAVAALLLAGGGAASADTQSFNADFFKPSLGRSTYLMLDNTQTLHQLQFNVGEIFSYGYRPLQITQGGARVEGVIDNLLVADFVAAIGATEWLQFAIDMPMVLINQFRDPLAVPAPPLKNYINAGDLRFEAKATVLNSCDGFLGLAFIPFITAPTGSKTHYVGDTGITGGMKVALDGRVHPNVGLTLNVGFEGGKKVNIRNITYQYNLILGGGVQGFFSHGVGVTAEVNALAATSKLFGNRDMNPAEALVGVNWDIKDTGVTVYGGGGTCITCGVKGARVRGVLGAKYRFNPEKYRVLDRQATGMCRAQFGKGMSLEEFKRLKMICPPNPNDYQAGVHDAACPRYYELSELADLILRCPARAEEFNPKVHDAACPKVFTLSDAYSKGEIMNIYELAAAEMGVLCPPNPADFNPQLHDLGCPKYYDLREVATLAQRCPENPEDYVAGRDDASCPKFYELREFYPEQAVAAVAELSQKQKELYEMTGVEGGEIKTLQPIYFDFNRDTIRPDMIPTLDAVAEVINQTPWIRRIRVGGNADARGTPEGNEKIGQRRAESVIRYLQSKGARPNITFESISYGANRPAASNETEEGRALNRRVVFIVTGWRAPTYVPPKKGVEQPSIPRSQTIEEWPSEETPSQKPPTRW